MSTQHSTLLPKTATMSNEFIVKFRSFGEVECCFDIVAVLGNNVAGFGNMFNLFRLCRKDEILLDMVAERIV